MLRRDPPRLFQEDVRIASEPEAPHASLVPVIQRERLATGGGHANREAGHQRVEHLEALAVRVQRIEIANGQGDGGHGVLLPLCFAHRRSLRGEPGVTPRRRFRATSIDHLHAQP